MIECQILWTYTLRIVLQTVKENYLNYEILEVKKLKLQCYN